MTLLTLATKQIWPHVLAVAHLNPNRVILLHSVDTVESKGPARRTQEAAGLKGYKGLRKRLRENSWFPQESLPPRVTMAAHQETGKVFEPFSVRPEFPRNPASAGSKPVGARPDAGLSALCWAMAWL